MPALPLTPLTCDCRWSSSSFWVKSDGTVSAWGQNANGQLGNNSTTESHVPVAVSGLTNASAVAGGTNHTLGLKSDGTVWAWRSNSNGQLGNNGAADNILVPTQSNMASVKLAGAQTTYAYNGEGLRMSKAGSGTAEAFT